MQKQFKDPFFKLSVKIYILNRKMEKQFKNRSRELSLKIYKKKIKKHKNSLRIHFLN